MITEVMLFNTIIIPPCSGEQRDNRYKRCFYSLALKLHPHANSEDLCQDLGSTLRSILRNKDYIRLYTYSSATLWTALAPIL